MQSRSLTEINLSALDDATFVAMQESMERERWRRKMAQDEADAIFWNTASDAEIIKRAEAEYPDAPIGLAGWYSETWYEQHKLHMNHMVKDRSRAPVFMKGAKWVLIAHYSNSGRGSANGWAEDVFWRFVRMKKITALDADDFSEKTDWIYRALHKKYHLSHHFDDRLNRGHWGFTPVIGGKKASLQPGQIQHIKALLDIIKKTERLDVAMRRALVKQSMMERLAA